MLTNKSEVFEKFTLQSTYVEDTFNSKLERLKSDNREEYCNWKFEEYFNSKGIKHIKNLSYSPEKEVLQK